MKKVEEISNPCSCFNKANDEEMLFVILERDPSAVATVMKWIEHRITLGINKPGDQKILAAFEWIDTVVMNRRK